MTFSEVVEAIKTLSLGEKEGNRSGGQNLII